MNLLKIKNINVNTNYTSSGSSIAANAAGTSYFKGGTTLVGELGPELVELPRGSKIFPANETKNKLGGQSVVNFNNTFTAKELSPSEINRKEEQMIRKLALSW